MASEDVVLVARLYRRLLVLVGCQFLILVFVAMTLSEPPSDGEIAIVTAAAVPYVGIVIGLVATMYRLTKQLAAGTPAIFAMGMLFPAVSFVVLPVIFLKAHAWCKARGIPMGFLGPELNRPESV